MLPKEKAKYLIQSSARLYDALALIQENKHRSLIVLSSGKMVVGTLSDGDVRKALLEGRLLEAPVSDVMNTRFISLSVKDRAKAPKIFAETHIFLIPILDARSRLLDIIEAY